MQAARCPACGDVTTEIACKDAHGDGGGSKVGSKATGNEVFQQQGTWASTDGVKLRDELARAPEQLKRSSAVGLVLRDTAGTSFDVVGGYLAGPTELAAEIEKQQQALAAVPRC